MEKFDIGEVLVSGIIDSASNGFIRKVVDIRYENNQYIGSVSDSNVTGNMVAKVHDLTYSDVSGRYESEMDTYFFAVVPEPFLNWESYTGAFDELM